MKESQEESCKNPCLKPITYHVRDAVNMRENLLRSNERKFLTCMRNTKWSKRIYAAHHPTLTDFNQITHGGGRVIQGERVSSTDIERLVKDDGETYVT